LHKVICRRIAEAGGTPYEIMAVGGYVALSMAKKYCETFRNRDMADTAFSRLNGTKGE
jgi:hypothetical protein